MRTSLAILALACAMIVCVPAIGLARSAGAQVPAEQYEAATPGLRIDTLWIFDADFEDLLGDNAGWTTEDLSGQVPSINYWHKDTIRINGFAHLGDSTWWCGTYENCWIQPRGYGNNWTCILSRSFPELASAVQPGDELVLEYDQRYAIEACYDYAYTDISTDAGETWTTLTALNNVNCTWHPGIPLDWDDEVAHHGAYGHMVLDLSDYAGQALDLRFRFESDGVYSSQDQYDNSWHSVRDGAWQIDNVAWYINDELFWLDDCENPGHNGWATDDWPGSEQTGVVYHRSYEEFDGHAGWMMVAYDSTSGVMAPDQHARLYSPLINVAGASELVVAWEGWVDLPQGADRSDYVMLRHRLSDSTDCIERHLPQHGHYDWGMSGVGATWMSVSDTSFYYSGENWLGLAFTAWGADETEPHGVGIAFDRIRVGVPLETGTPEGSVFSDEIRAVRPNPFNPSTTVEFTVNRGGRVALRVYDVAGRLVTTLRDEELEPGEHEATWDGTDDSGQRVASGVYMLRLEAGGGTSASMKAVLVE